MVERKPVESTWANCLQRARRRLEREGKPLPLLRGPQRDPFQGIASGLEKLTAAGGPSLAALAREDDAA